MLIYLKIFCKGFPWRSAARMEGQSDKSNILKLLLEQLIYNKDGHCKFNLFNWLFLHSNFNKVIDFKSNSFNSLQLQFKFVNDASAGNSKTFKRFSAHVKFCKRGQSFTFKEVKSLYKQSNIVKHLHLSTFNVLS